MNIEIVMENIEQMMNEHTDALVTQLLDVGIFNPDSSMTLVLEEE
jgi:hypothetical protein